MSYFLTPEDLFAYFSLGNAVSFLIEEWKTLSAVPYMLALLVIFIVPTVNEWAIGKFLGGKQALGFNDRIVKTAVYTLTKTVAYMLMLLAMSFNVGIFLAIVAGFGLSKFILNNERR